MIDTYEKDFETSSFLSPTNLSDWWLVVSVAKKKKKNTLTSEICLAEHQSSTRCQNLTQAVNRQQIFTAVFVWIHLPMTTMLILIEDLLVTISLSTILDRQHSGKSSLHSQVIYWSPPFKEKSQAIHIHIYFFFFWSPYGILMNPYKPTSLWLYIFNYVACFTYSYSVLCDVKE